MRCRASSSRPTGIGTQILYDIPVPYNPEFGRGLNAAAACRAGPASRRSASPASSSTRRSRRSTPRAGSSTASSASAQHWMVEIGYVGTRGVNLERIDDVNRFAGDLLDGREDRINPNFSVLLFVTNGVTSSYHAFTVGAAPRVRRRLLDADQLPLVALARHVVRHVDRPVPGQLRARQGRAGHRLPPLRARPLALRRAAPLLGLGAGLGAARGFDGRDDLLGHLARDWQMSAIVTAQSGPAVLGLERRGVRGRRRLQRRRRRRRGRRRLLRSPERAGAGRGRRAASASDDFLNGLFDASAFPKPAPGTNGTLGRNTFRGPRYVDARPVADAASLPSAASARLQLRLDVYNALNTLNLFLPNADLSRVELRQVDAGVRRARHPARREVQF